MAALGVGEGVVDGGQPQDLHVGGDPGFAEQLGARLEDFPRPRAVLPPRVLAVDLAGVPKPQGRGPRGELRRRESGDAGREIVAQGEEPPVQVEKANQPVGQVATVAAGAEEDLGVLEGGRDDLIVPGRVQSLAHALLELPPPAHRIAGEVRRAGRDGRDARPELHVLAGRVAATGVTRTVPTRRPSIATISNSAPPTARRSPALGRRPSLPNSSPPIVV